MSIYVRIFLTLPSLNQAWKQIRFNILYKRELILNNISLVKIDFQDLRNYKIHYYILWPTVKDYSVQEKLAGLVKLQKIDSKLGGIKILKGELPIEVSDLEDEIQGLNSRKNRIEEEINGITEFIRTKKTSY